MVGIFPYGGITEFAECKCQFVAGVVFQRDFSCCRCLHIEIGIWSVGDELVAESVDIQVARAHLGIEAVEVILLCLLRRPYAIALGFLHLQFDGI